MNKKRKWAHDGVGRFVKPFARLSQPGSKSESQASDGVYMNKGLAKPTKSVARKALQGRQMVGP